MEWFYGEGVFCCVVGFLGVKIVFVVVSED